MDNQLRAHRTRAGISQRALADAVGTSQQSIQRIESGLQNVRLDLAVSISHALKTPLGTLFPRITDIPKESRSKPIRELEGEFREAGLEMLHVLETLKARLRGGHDVYFSFEKAEKDRIRSNIDSIGSDKESTFVVFDSADRRVAINRMHIQFCQLLFDPLSSEREIDWDQESSLKFLMSDGAVLNFSVDPDQVEMDGEEEDWDSIQLQHLFVMIDGESSEETITFVDVDGEQAYLRADDVAAVIARLSYVEPKLFELEMEAFEEEEGRDEQLAKDPSESPVE